METETRVVEPLSVSPAEIVAATESRTCTQTKLSAELGNIPEMEREKLSVNLPEPSAVNVLNSPIEEENANLIGHLPDLTSNISKPVKKQSIPSAEIEVDNDHMSLQNQMAEPQQKGIQPNSHYADSHGMERDELLNEGG